MSPVVDLPEGVAGNITGAEVFGCVDGMLSSDLFICFCHKDSTSSPTKAFVLLRRAFPASQDLVILRQGYKAVFDDHQFFLESLATTM